LSEPPLFNLDPAASEAILCSIKKPVERALQEGGAEAAQQAFFEVVCPGLWQRLDEPRRAAYRENSPLLLPTLGAPTGTVTPRDLQTVEVPTCVVAGSESPEWVRRLARRLADTLPMASYVCLEGAGHATYVDAPESFARLVTEFVIAPERRRLTGCS